MTLDRQTVDRTCRAHIRQVQQIRHVNAAEKEQIRRMHEKAAQRVEAKTRT